MLNKRGNWLNGTFKFAVAVALILGFIYIIWGNPFEGGNGDSIQGTFYNYVGQVTPFDVYWGENARFLNYVFGGVPSIIDNVVESQYVSPFILIGIWLILLLIMADILSLFSMFSTFTSWTIAVILTVIAANIKILNVILVAAFALTSFLGAFSVVAAIILIFLTFIAFHFGTNSFREKIILRRAQDSALRAVAGGKKAASGIQVLKDIAAKAGSGEKK